MIEVRLVLLHDLAERALVEDEEEAEAFAPAVESVSELIVPILNLYEVFKRVLQQRGEGDALQAVAVMAQGTVVDLDIDVALDAAKLSVWRFDRRRAVC